MLTHAKFRKGKSQALSLPGYFHKQQFTEAAALSRGSKEESWGKGGLGRKARALWNSEIWFIFWVQFLVVVKTDSGASFIPGKHFITELYLKPQFFHIYLQY